MSAGMVSERKDDHRLFERACLFIIERDTRKEKNVFCDTIDMINTVITHNDNNNWIRNCVYLSLMISISKHV